MKKNIYMAGVTGLFAAVLGACSPMDDDCWDENITCATQWQDANPETGRRPADLGEMVAFYYPQMGNDLYFSYTLTKEVEEFDVPEGSYDALIIPKSDFVTSTDMYRLASISIPSLYNENGEKVITDNPTEMIYCGRLENMDVKLNERSKHTFVMTRCLKEISFNIIVKDSAELVGDCQVDISGLATEMTLHDTTIKEGEQAILKFNIHKEGRVAADADDYVITNYKGKQYFLGVAGNNIDNVLYITLTNSRGEEKKMSLNITTYLHYWNTENVNFTIYIDAEKGTLSYGTWNEESGDDIYIDL